MAIISCKAGKHFYDNEKYGRCPFCDGTINLGELRTKKDEESVAHDPKDDETLTVTKPN